MDALEYSFDEYDPEPPEPYVTGLRCIRMQLGEPDASGRRRPVPIEGSEFTIPAATVLTALGEDSDLDFLPADVRREKGALPVGPLGGTSQPRTFAGGDVIEEPHTVAYAIGAGKRAAIGIDRYLRVRAGEIGEGTDLGELRYGATGNLSVTRWRADDPVRRADPVNEVVAPEALNLAHFPRVAGQPDRQLSDAERRGFDETNRGLSEEAALREARRCFNCAVCNQCELCLIFCPDVAISRTDGGFEIAYEYCKGCGLCAAECPRGAIEMTREGL
jgi:2-oxoacid:acceptor oxidoreductase delta subunit (pyruvate/2-ketoisovalerate family)